MLLTRPRKGQMVRWAPLAVLTGVVGLVGACGEGIAADSSGSAVSSTREGPGGSEPTHAPTRDKEIALGADVRQEGNGRIAFVAEKHDSPDESEPGFERVYTVGPDGTSPRVLLEARRRGYSADHYDALSWAPDGARITILGQSIHGAPHFTLDQQGGGRHALPLDPDLTSAAAWAPDGRLLAYAVGDEVRVLDTRSDEDRTVWRAGRSAIFGRLSWTSGGEVAAMTGRGGTGRPRVLRLIDMTDGSTRVVLRRPGGMSDALLSPDGTAAAVLGDSRTDCSRTLTVVDLSTGRSHPVTSECVSPAGFDWSPDSQRLVFANVAGDPSEEAALWSVPASGGEPTGLLTAASIGGDRIAAVAWQPTEP